MSHEFENGNVYDMVERAMNACMRRIRAGYIHNDMVRSLIEHRENAARLIQNQFRLAIASPRHLMCRRRLMREFHQLESVCV